MSCNKMELDRWMDGWMDHSVQIVIAINIIMYKTLKLDYWSIIQQLSGFCKAKLCQINRVKHSVFNQQTLWCGISADNS